MLLFLFGLIFFIFFVCVILSIFFKKNKNCVMEGEVVKQDHQEDEKSFYNGKHKKTEDYMNEIYKMIREAKKKSENKS